jgi:prepilin-type N-terminal cleavage/methylation domain-containing protein
VFCFKSNFLARISKKGFTIVEMIVVIALSALIVGTTVSMFSSLSNVQSLDKDAENVGAYLLKARNQTVNAKNNAVYSVHFASTTVTLFQGASYVSGSSTNQVYSLSSKVSLVSYMFSPATTTITFQKMTGKPSATGTIIYTLNNDASSTRSILIYGSGLIEIR